MIKKILLFSVLSLFVILGGISCKTVDIRTAEVKNNFNPELGISVLRQMYQAHSLNNWDSIETYSLHLTDEFFGIMGAFSNPFPDNKADFEFQAIPNTFTSKVKFRDKKWQGKIWGIQSWKTFSSNKKSTIERHEKNDKKIEFWLPTYQYFIEIPLRIFEANKISYAGTKTVEGHSYDLVFASWARAEPQREIDQYILWIDQETHLLKQIQYTVRDQYRWVHATLKYTNYSRPNGLVLFPTEMEINLFGPNQKKTLHKIKIDQIKLNPIPKDSLIVFRDLELHGKQGTANNN